MQIQIELLLIITLIFMFFAYKIWFKLTNKINIRRYKPENDKSRKGEEQRIAELKAGERRIEKEPGNVPGPSEPKRPINLPPTTSDIIGKTSYSDGKVSRKFRNPFRRRRK